MEGKIFPVEDEVTRKRLQKWNRIFFDPLTGFVTDAISSLKPYIWKCINTHKVETKWKDDKETKILRKFYATVRLV